MGGVLGRFVFGLFALATISAGGHFDDQPTTIISAVWTDAVGLDLALAVRTDHKDVAGDSEVCRAFTFALFGATFGGEAHGRVRLIEEGS